MGLYVLVGTDEGHLGVDAGSPFFSEVRAHQKEEEYTCLAETIEADSLDEAKRKFRSMHPEYLNKNFQKRVAEEVLD